MIRKILKTFIAVVVVGALIVGGGGFYLYSKYLGASIVAAQVRGPALINGVQTNATVAMLEEGDTVETKNSRATVFLQESIIVMLEPQTKIVIETIDPSDTVIRHMAGSSWNHVTKLRDVERYTVLEGKNIAMVTGTSFQLSVNKIAVLEGTVAYEIDGKTFQVNAGKAVEKRGESAAFERPLPPVEKAAVLKSVTQTVQELRFLREQEIAKYPELVARVKEQFDITDAQIAQGLFAADEGRVNVDELAKKSPIKIPVLNRLIEMTKEIQRLIALTRKPL